MSRPTDDAGDDSADDTGGARRATGEPDHWFEPLAEHLGSAYLRYSFTKGTVQEIDHLVTVLELDASTRVLDVGCGPGRHAHELARRGIPVHGVDISGTFVELARATAPFGATFSRQDARRLPFVAEFDRAICLCQGAFGLMRRDGDDERVLESMATALRPGGLLALSAFNAYFSVRYHLDAEFDADSGISHERTEIRDPGGRAVEVDLWTGCYTPRELRLLLGRVGFEVIGLSSVDPGHYGSSVPTVDSSEFLVIARWP